MDHVSNVLSHATSSSIAFLADAGVVILLFRVGLECNLPAMIRRLDNALVVWFFNFFISAALGFAVVMTVTDFGLIPALFAGAALSATSVGVSSVIWRDMNALDSDAGGLLVDVAEMDDISAVIFISVLFAVAPVLRESSLDAFGGTVFSIVGILIAKLIGLLALIVLFSNYIEQHLTRWITRVEPNSGPVLLATGVAFVIAAFADFMGFSLAIGALLAGLAFSRDPVEAKIDRSFTHLDSFFTPFFFITIGLSVDLFALGTAAVLGSLLLIAAIVGKVFGAGIPAIFFTDRPTGLLIGVSMVPRAEIALIVMNHGLALGAWAVPDKLYYAIVLVSLFTCLLAPIAVQNLLRAHPLNREQTT